MNTEIAEHSSSRITRKPNSLPTDDVRRRGNGGLTKAVKVAIEAQVFEGLRRRDAAKQAGIAEHTLYQALRKPSVLAYWNACLQVLRTGERARNIHRLVQIRDKADNMPAVNAIKMLEHIDELSTARPGAAQVPGFTIVVVQAPSVTGPQRHIDAKPLIEHKAGSHPPVTDAGPARGHD